MNRHLTNDELLNRLYGIGGPDAESHLRHCPECAGRYEAFERRRAQATSSSTVKTPHEFLAAQRRAVYARLGETPGGQARQIAQWTPAVAAAALLTLGLFLYRPSTSAPEAQAPAVHAELNPAEPGDAQLFSDVYSIEESAEPLAAAPIQALFDFTAGEDGQN
jgi:hypothetical protein